LGPADFLVPIAALVSLILSYPAALIMVHHADLRDESRKGQEEKNKADV
jgi:hypothetical protein